MLSEIKRTSMKYPMATAIAAALCLTVALALIVVVPVSSEPSQSLSVQSGASGPPSQIDHTSAEADSAVPINIVAPDAARLDERRVTSLPAERHSSSTARLVSLPGTAPDETNLLVTPTPRHVGAQ